MHSNTDLNETNVIKELNYIYCPTFAETSILSVKVTDSLCLSHLFFSHLINKRCGELVERGILEGVTYSVTLRSGERKG